MTASEIDPDVQAFLEGMGGLEDAVRQVAWAVHLLAYATNPQRVDHPGWKERNDG